MSNVKEFLGITQNSCTFQGKVVGDPLFSGDNYGYMVVRTAVSEQAANGSWVDVTVDVPVITTDPKKVAVMRDHIKDGRELMVETYYTSWQAEGKPQHGFMIKRTVLGRKKYEPKPQG